MTRAKDPAAEEPDRFLQTPHPRFATTLLGQDEAEQALLAAYRSGRMPHAWLIGGRAGIGKATLAYRAARFIMANPDVTAPAVQLAATLETDPEIPAVRQILAAAHPDLVVVRRSLRADRKALATEVRVEDVRRATHLLGSTAAAGGWRVVIVDSIDELNRNAANALLKTLEEPPAKALFLLVSHAPGRLLPTIRSRCRALMLKPLPAPAIAALLQRFGAAAKGRDLDSLASGAEGSIRAALERLDRDHAGLEVKVGHLLERLPILDARGVQDLAQAVDGRSGREALAGIQAMVERFLSARLRAGAAHGAARLAPYAEVWEKLAASSREAEAYNLDRRPVVLALFRNLSDAVAAERAASG